MGIPEVHMYVFKFEYDAYIPLIAIVNPVNPIHVNQSRLPVRLPGELHVQ